MIRAALLALILSGCAMFEQPVSFCEWIPPAQEKPLTAYWQVVTPEERDRMCKPGQVACYHEHADVIVATTRFGDTPKFTRDHEILHAKGWDHKHDCR